MPKPTDISAHLVLAKARHLRDRIDKLLGEAKVPGMWESAVRRLRTIVEPEERADYERRLAEQREWITGIQERNLLRAIFRADLPVVQGLQRHLKKSFKHDETTPPVFMEKLAEYLVANPEADQLGKRFLAKGWTYKAAMKLRESEPREWLLDATATDLKISVKTLEKVLTEKLHPGQRYKSLRRSRLDESP